MVEINTTVVAIDKVETDMEVTDKVASKERITLTEEEEDKVDKEVEVDHLTTTEVEETSISKEVVNHSTKNIDHFIFNYLNPYIFF